MTSPADDTPQSDGQQSDSDRHNAKTVSYTHLTLPTSR